MSNLNNKGWTLESAQRDYRNRKKNCKNCEFTGTNSAYTNCHIKKDCYGYFRRLRAKLCKYYTPKEVR